MLAPVARTCKARRTTASRPRGPAENRTRMTSLPRRSASLRTSPKVEVPGNAPGCRPCGGRQQPSAHPRLRVWQVTLLHSEFWRLRWRFAADPWRPVGRSNPSQSIDNRPATPVASRGVTSSPRRESNADTALRRREPESVRTKRWGDVRVMLPSKTRPQRAGVTSSLTSQSERLELNQPHLVPETSAWAARLRSENTQSERRGSTHWVLLPRQAVYPRPSL